MKIVSLAPSNTEIIYRLGAQEDLEATTSLCDYPPGALNKKNAGGWTSGIDFDKIRSLEPDIVLTSDSLQEEVVEELECLEVLHVTPQTLEEIYKSFRKIAGRLDTEEQAEELIHEMKESLHRLETDGNPRVYCEEWMDPPMASGNWIPGLIEKIGGESFLNEGERSKRFELEKLKSFDPEYIFLNVCGAGQNIDVSDILERDGWQDITAVKEGNVFVVDDALLNRPSPRVVKGARKMLEKIEK